MKIHKLACPDCEHEFYSHLPDEIPTEKEEPCPSCDRGLRMNYQESEQEDVVTDIEISIREDV